MMELWQLFRTFFTIGIMTFGGGYAMLPMLQREVVNRHGWVTEEELLDYFAIGQCTPGIIAVNTATFVGAKRRGVAGGIVATLGVIAPSLLIIMAIAMVLEQFMDNAILGHAFAGIRVAVTALIGASVVKLARSTVKNVFGMVLCVLAFLAVALLGASPVVVVVCAAVAGLAAGKVRESK